MTNLRYDEELWPEIESTARERLRDPIAGDEFLTDPRVRVRLELCHWRFPAFEAFQSWSVLRSRSGRTGEERLFVRRTTWDRVADWEFVSRPGQEVVRREPTLRTLDGDLDPAEWKARLESLGRIGLASVLPNKSDVLDGVECGLAVPERIELLWSEGSIDGWKAVVEWSDGLREWLESALPR